MALEDFPMFHKNRFTSALSILEILDEVSPQLPSERGVNNINEEADGHVSRLESLVNLYGGAKTAIAMKILALFEQGWIALSSAARENHARNDEDAMRMVMEAVGLTGEMSHYQLAQLKTFLTRTLPEVKRATDIPYEDQVEFVAGCLKETADGLSARVERNIRNANVLTARNPVLSKDQAETVVSALKSGEISRELEAMAEDRPVRADARAPGRTECQMLVISPDGTTEFKIRVPYDMSPATEKLLSRYFDIKPY